MIIDKDQETIIALCTPKGKGAIALLRLCGQNAREVVNNFSKLANKDINQADSGTVNYGWIIDENKTIVDQVLFLIMDGPKTFTGQNTIEITCHNNPFLIENIINLAIKNGARIAQEGEFTRRAFLNGKIDLIQAEAINDLIGANTQLALKKSMAQLEGSLSNWISDLEKELIKALAWSEASFEFLDEENLSFGNQIKEHINNQINKINIIKKTFDNQKQIKEGIRIAIIGSVNAGKSSLFNTILNQKRSIVTNIAGTTRDSIESGIYRNGNFWTLIDTAGLRQTNDIIEELGINRSFEEAQKADIILLVFDSSENLSPEQEKVYKNLLEKYKNKIILIQNKADLPENKSNFLYKYNDIKNKIKVSSANNLNIDKLENLIESKISQIFESIDSPFLLNQRQYNIILGLEIKLKNILDMLNDNIQYELVSYNIKDALEDLTQLTGKSISEAGLDTVFKEFCVGK